MIPRVGRALSLAAWLVSGVPGASPAHAANLHSTAPATSPASLRTASPLERLTLTATPKILNPLQDPGCSWGWRAHRSNGWRGNRSFSNRTTSSPSCRR